MHYAYLQFLLSNPVTHSANILGTGAATAAMYPERYVAEWINKIFFQSAEGVARGETWAMMRAAGEATTNGVRLLGRAIRHGEQALGTPGRIETKFDISAAYFGIDPKSPIGVLMDTVGAVAPTRLMMGEDAFYKGFIKPGVDPVSWTPHGWGGKECPRCRRAIGRTRRSSGSGSSSWSAKGERLRSWRASSSPRPKRSGIG
jgi:hypothetical protein